MASFMECDEAYISKIPVSRRHPEVARIAISSEKIHILLELCYNSSIIPGSKGRKYDISLHTRGFSNLGPARHKKGKGTVYSAQNMWEEGSHADCDAEKPKF